MTVPTDAGFPAVRDLGPGDLARCVALGVDRGWLPDRPRWGLFLATCAVFGVDAPDGRGLAGAVVLTRWEPGLASVGMMLVAARYGRRGLGRTLMEHALAAAGPATTVTLYATEMGRPLYEKLGFWPVRRSVSFAGRFRPPAGSGSGPGSAAGRTAAVRTAAVRTAAVRTAAGRTAAVRTATEADLPAILAVDRAAFGADRGPVIGRLPGFAERIAVLEEDGREIVGYAAAWRNDVTSTVIGPVVAPGGPAARLLITDLAAPLRTPVRLDLDPDRAELPGWASGRGLEPVARTTVMAHGGLPPRGTPERLFAPISVALA